MHTSMVGGCFAIALASGMFFFVWMLIAAVLGYPFVVLADALGVPNAFAKNGFVFVTFVLTIPALVLVDWVYRKLKKRRGRARSKTDSNSELPLDNLR